MAESRENHSNVLFSYADKVRIGLRVKNGVNIRAHFALGLTGEAGEVADLIKKAEYPNGRLDIEELVGELGDVLWYLQSLANLCGITIEQLAVHNIDKLVERYPADYTPIPL